MDHGLTQMFGYKPKRGQPEMLSAKSISSDYTKSSSFVKNMD